MQPVPEENKLVSPTERVPRKEESPRQRISQKAEATEESPRSRIQKGVITDKRFSFGPGGEKGDKHARFSFGRKNKEGVVSSAVPKPLDVAEIQTIAEPIQRSRRILARGRDA